MDTSLFKILVHPEQTLGLLKSSTSAHSNEDTCRACVPSSPKDFGPKSDPEHTGRKWLVSLSPPQLLRLSVDTHH